MSKLRAVWICCRFDATQSRLVAVIAGTEGEGGRAERCVIVTGYLYTKFFTLRNLHGGGTPLFWLMGPTVPSYISFCAFCQLRFVHEPCRPYVGYYV